MSNLRLFTLSAIIIAILVAVPHLTAAFTQIPQLDQNAVDEFFYVFNELSFVYVFIPFFFLELIRYFYIRKLNKDLILDSVANAITLVAFIAIEIVVGLLFAYKLYAIASEYAILPELPINWVTILFCILLADFLYYWEHRMMHRIGIGWATHTVHHSSPHFNISVAYRFGPMDMLFPLPFSLAAVMMGFNPFLMLSAEIFVQTYQAILHTEMIKKLPKPIEAIFNTPSHHRVHHARNRVYWDKNYAGILIIWDKWLGSFREEVEEVDYGVVKKINSVNPLVVFFHGMTRLYGEIKNTDSVKNKMLRLVKPPGWNPR